MHAVYFCIGEFPTDAQKSRVVRSLIIEEGKRKEKHCDERNIKRGVITKWSIFIGGRSSHSLT